MKKLIVKEGTYNKLLTVCEGLDLLVKKTVELILMGAGIMAFSLIFWSVFGFILNNF